MYRVGVSYSTLCVLDCPPGKGLVFLYPNNSNEDYLLPVSYTILIKGVGTRGHPQ